MPSRRAPSSTGSTRACALTIPEATAFAIMPPSIPGLGNQGGFSMWIQDRSGGSIEFLDEQVKTFLAEARKRPELAGVNTPFSAAIPQLYADVDTEKALRQGVALGDVYQTMQAFLGGLYVNQFNRFGRQWRVFLQADAADRAAPDQVGQFYVRNSEGAMVPLSAVQTMRESTGPLFSQPVQRLSRRSDYRGRRAWLQLRPGDCGARGRGAPDAVAGVQLRLVRPDLSGAAGVRHHRC